MAFFTRKPIAGLFPLLPLSLDERQEIDYDAIRFNLGLLSAAGVPGVVVFGSMGQMHSVGEGEFDRVCDETVAAAAELGLAIVVGASSTSGRETIRRARRAEATGADGTMIATPYGLPLTLDSAAGFYADVAEALTGDIAIMTYNYPPLTGINLTPEIWHERLLTIPAIRAHKESNMALPHLDEILTTVADKVNVFAGNDPAFWHASMLGAAGSTAIFSWAALQVGNQFVQACLAGRHREAWTMQAFHALQHASAAMRRADMPPLLSYEYGYLNAIVEYGHGRTGAPRRPYAALPENARRAIEEALLPLRRLEHELGSSPLTEVVQLSEVI
jgi:dihydrodipicolinate synthase/N-acetylneuraminate lyase